MPHGVQVEIERGFAHIEFLDPSTRGTALAALVAAGGPGLIDVDTSGSRKTYIVPESIAAQAGVLESAPAAAPKLTPKRRAKSVPVDG